MVKICLDPGHGGTDSGALLGKRYEKDDVLRLALAVKPLLEAQGVGVVMTRTDDKSVPPIAERCQMANTAGCVYYLSIHRDAAGPAAHGISLWVHSRANDPTVRKAQDILDELLAVTPTQDRGVQKGTPQNYENFGVNVYTTMASALLELGFITNADDNDRFDRYFDDYAEAIARGLCKAVGVTYTAKDKPAEAPEEETATIPRGDWDALCAALQAAHDATGEAVEKLKKMLGV
ncbi:N-acetylmuramoyl-L-alanine amidase [Anaerotruncus sp. DFI.9.16]|uniref:N-acetylmuramoyl-L-alanine amidase family protein n=1 Tax=Anaerotruncus sp. DFI.9.16 TaxID=2965275 RepID=UPI0021089F22|nr:N-acetylmuramoyl-L-alanine amidase [Anaerotruncus sp. DFI.9.16]MCQ4895568.1 N-acetylmuramoyl-L-alanine amidase [Anaerotruncus sp. DFI.9.16]